MGVRVLPFFEGWLFSVHRYDRELVLSENLGVGVKIVRAGLRSYVIEARHDCTTLRSFARSLVPTRFLARSGAGEFVRPNIRGVDFNAARIAGGEQTGTVFHAFSTH